MKKAGVISLYGNYNYGNRLQNYAVQEALKKVNIDAKSIRYFSKERSDIIPSIFDQERHDLFLEFNKNINFYETELYSKVEPSKDFGNDLDYYVVGSDQIWNFTFVNAFTPNAFAGFSDKPKVAFSASVGVDFMPEENSNEYKIFEDNLNKFHKISIREEAGKDIVSNISKRDDVEVLIDPTMFLEAKDWEKVMKRPAQLDTDKFILKSFLGNVEPEAEAELERVAKENGCKIIDISSKDSEFFKIGPAEFIYLEKNAFLVATDSFHSCVFATIFSTPFVIFRRDTNSLASMYSRIETLLSTFGMEYRMFVGKIDETILNNNYENVQDKLKDKREEGYKFLELAFNN